MTRATGTLTIRFEGDCFTLRFSDNGWMAADMVQFLEDVLWADDPRTAILELLGFTMEISREPPPRSADHWVEIDLENRVLSTNSDLIRRVVKHEDPADSHPLHALSFPRIYRVLDRGDFKVELYF